MKIKRLTKKQKKILIVGGVVVSGFLLYRYVINLKSQIENSNRQIEANILGIESQIKADKLKYKGKSGNRIYFELPIINDSDLSAELVSFEGGVLFVGNKNIGEVFIEPAFLAAKSTTLLKFSLKYKFWSVISELWQVIIHNAWNTVPAKLTGKLNAKGFATNYPLELTLR